MIFFTYPTRFLAILCLTILTTSQLPSQTNQAGKLLPIDYSQINPDVYELGKFRIKFKAIAEKHLETPKQLKSQSGIAVTGIREVDALNRKFNVEKGKGLLSNLYDSPLKSASLQTERHKKSGLHLWYEFETGKDVNLGELIQRYKKLESVEIVEPVFKIIPIVPVSNPSGKAENTEAIKQNWIPDDEHFSGQWHYHNTGQNNGKEDADIDLPEAWESIQGNPDVIVAVIDQGVDFNHPDLAGNIWPEIGPEGESTYPGDHGTHVAGTIAALNNNAIGVSGIAGGSGNNNGVRIMSLDLFNGQHEMSTLEMNVYAADNGAAISQNSWGYMGPEYYNQSDLDGIDYFNEYGGGDVMEGGITFFAAGNDSDYGNWFPGCYEGAIAVAATNNNDQISWYSNYGDWVDISAPGGETSPTYEAGILSTTANGNYHFYQGTSMACPHVSGVAALVLSQAPGFLTNEDLANIILNSADDHYANNQGYEGQLGSGRLNAFNAIEMAQGYMGNVRNPFSFSAQGISENSIHLSWKLNENANHVMLVLSENRNFGSPVDGYSYSIGDQLPEGGVIQYIGNDLMTDIENLQRNTTFYFKIWSFDENKAYSFGRSDQARTFSPQISLSSENIDYKTAYIGYPKSHILEIINSGESNLTLSNISFSNNCLASPENPTIIEADTNFEWEIIFNPPQPGSYTEALSFETNVPGQEQIIIPIYGEASDQVPAMEYSPATIEETLHAGESTTRTVELTNTGDADLTYNIVPLPKETKNPTTTTSDLLTAGSPVPSRKDKISRQLYNDREINENGGSYEAGYYWETTNYEWYDTSDGTSVNLHDDASQSDIPLGFSFNYYEDNFSSIMVKSNGWVSFTNYSEWYPDCVPGEGGAICPFGLDLLPDNEGYIRYKTIGSEPSRKFVVEYNNIRLFESSLRNTFQIILSEGSNVIHFQYKNIESAPYSIGIDNINGTKGIGNCGTGENFLNPEIVTNNLSIRFRPASRYIISPALGILEPGQSTSVSITINTPGLIENTYYQDIAIFNNDPRQEEVIIPLTLHVVGTPDLQIETDTVYLEPSFLGNTTNEIVILDNSAGTKTVNISNISVSGPPFELGSWPETIAPGEKDTIEINITPEQKEHFEGSLTIFSNDPDIPEKTIFLIGEGIIPPVMEANPEIFEAELYSGDSITRTLTINNTGNNSIPLEVYLQIENINVQEGAPQLIPGTPVGFKALTPGPKAIHAENRAKHPVPKSENGAKVLFLTSLEALGISFHQDMENLSNVSTVDSVIISRHTPNTAYLHQYDLVVMATSYMIANPILLGDNLADYIDRGGRLCVLNGALSTGGEWTIAGRIAEEDYLPLEPNQYSTTPTSCNSFIDHPLTKNLNILETGIHSFNSPQGTGISLGSFDSGYSCLAYNPDKPIVAINLYPGNGYYNEELLTLMENTINWLKNRSSWLHTDQRQLNIEAETSQEVTLTFNASGMDAGIYNANIFLGSNDPKATEDTIPATLKVIDAPHFTINKSVFNFEETPIGVGKTMAGEISNTGSVPLEITSLDFSDQNFECNETAPITLDPGETKYLNITFAPESPVDYIGILTIASTDPTTPEITIDLTGTGYHAPLIDVGPLSLEEQISEGENISSTLTINNEGLGEALTYSITINYENTGNGSNDGNYIWSIVEPEYSDIFEATEIPLGDDDYALNIPLGFAFYYYNEEFSSVNIMSNGWISFTDYDSWYPGCIPGTNGEIAPNPRDLNTYSGQSIRYITTGEAPFRKFIIDYYTSILGQSETEHFQIILEETSNKIKFQYPDISEPPRNVGISSPDGTKGIGNCANDSLFISPDLIASGKAIEFIKAPKDWLSVTPASGTIEKNGQTDIEVLMPTTNLPAGTYNANLVVQHNEPLKSSVNIPITLIIDELRKYSLTFNFQNQFAETLNDVTISFNGLQELDGISQITNLTAGTYEYSVSKNGYSQGTNAYGQVTIDNSDITIEVTLNALLQHIYLQAYPPGSGTFTGAQSYYTDQRVYLEALPAGGFQFQNWTNQENNIIAEQAGYSFIMPPFNIMLTGNFGTFSSLPEINDGLVSVYPNPARETVQVKTMKPEEVHLIEIISPKGEVIKQRKTNGNEINSFNIGDLTPATYLLRVNSTDGIRYFKFVKK